jgi:phosphoglycolate phosphatase-like HAD superfamily hydrolase
MRLFILLLSIACVAAYGYALAGYAGESFGKGRTDYIVWGLTVGTLCGAAALRLWKNWVREAAPDFLIFGIDELLATNAGPEGGPRGREIPHWSGFGLPVAIFARRSPDETERTLSRLGWEDFPRDSVIYSGDSSGRSVGKLCGGAGAKNPFFFGSTLADKEAWDAYGKGVFVAVGPNLANDPAPVWNSLHFDTLERALRALLPHIRLGKHF